MDPDTESDKPPNEKAALAGGSLRKAESRAYPTVSGLLVKQISHLLCAAERLQPRSRASSLVKITMGIWRRRIAIRRGGRAHHE
jgi:hypothetical protein